jgi:hypothetical protein
VLPSDLPREWRERAGELEPYAAPAAEAFRRAAGELDTWLHGWWSEPLELDQAREESGYSRDSLLRFLREGTVPNMGTLDDPRIRRADLPCKPGHRRPLPWQDEAEQTPAIASARRLHASSARQAVRSAEDP